MLIFANFQQRQPGTFLLYATHYYMHLLILSQIQVLIFTFPVSLSKITLRINFVMYHRALNLKTHYEAYVDFLQRSQS